MSVKFIDLFAGIGGFHAAAHTLGWECVYACEIDADAAKIYAKNWGLNPLNDITVDASENTMNVPAHDVLFAGFPCQPFSKSGKQLGMEETRGTLFWNILRIIDHHRPAIVLLENVRNLAGPQHRHEWKVIIEQLRSLGYRVSDIPFVVSPHRIRRDAGGRPQIRERVFIAATRIPDGVDDSAEIPPIELRQDCVVYDTNIWDLKNDLPLQKRAKETSAMRLSEDEELIIETWNKLLVALLKERKGAQLPGFPLWTEYWKSATSKEELLFPEWKKNFIRKNRDFYLTHRETIDKWRKENPHFESFPASRKKLEWQAQDSKNLWETIIHFRPSGLRAKRATYVPALVAITQTSIVASEKRRLTVRESARLQGLPDWFSFEGQSDAKSYKQLGNGVSIGAVYQVLRAIGHRDSALLEKTHPKLAKQLSNAAVSPDPFLE